MRHTRKIGAIVIVAGLCFLMFGDKAPGASTPLHDAARKGDKEAVKRLLAEGADVNAADKSFGRTPLHWAANKDVAEPLLAKGANVNATDKFDGTPLHWAANKDVAELLLAKGANVNARSAGRHDAAALGGELGAQGCRGTSPCEGGRRERGG